MLFVILLTEMVSTKLCQNSYFQFKSIYGLGKQDQLNKTFTKITLPQMASISYSPKTATTYLISDLILTFNYIDAKQHATFIENDVFMISGGYVNLHYEVSIQKKYITSKKGNAYGSVNSNEIIFQKIIQINEQDFPMWTLKSFQQFKISNNLGISTIKGDFTINDQDIFLEMMNSITQIKNVKLFIQQEITKQFSTTLNSSLHDQTYIYNKTQTYIYTEPSKGAQEVIFQYNVNQIKAVQEGLSLFYSMVIQNYTDYECGAQVPLEPADIDYYGGVQSFFSNAIMDNTFKYGRSKGWWDSYLNEIEWGTNAFQFRIGDLYEVIPELVNDYLPSEKLTGKCESYGLPHLTRFNFSDTNASINYKCYFQQKQVVIVNITFRLDMMLELIAHKTIMQFRIRDALYDELRYDIIPPFIVLNKQLAQFYIGDVLKNLRGHYTFGTAFGIHKRPYPNIQIFKQGYTLIYDTTHIPHFQIQI